MKLLVRFWYVLPVFALGACDPDPGPPPNIPDSASICQGSCIILKHFSCEEGVDPLCVQKCEHVHSLGYIWPDDKSGPQCVVEHASTIEQIRACNVRCWVEK